MGVVWTRVLQIFLLLFIYLFIYLSYHTYKTRLKASNLKFTRIVGEQILCTNIVTLSGIKKIKVWQRKEIEYQLTQSFVKSTAEIFIAW